MYNFYGEEFMFVKDKEQLHIFYSKRRVWQGMPTIAVTRKGRIFSAFYSGGTSEGTENFVLLLKSDDQKDFGEPIAVCYSPLGRCFDPCLWIDPLNRLWLFWSFQPTREEGTYAVVCDNPDEDELCWSTPFFIGHNVMLNKPTVLSSGEWLFPISVWENSLRKIYPVDAKMPRKTGAFVYKSVDNGKTFTVIGSTVIKNRSFDEHMIVEMKDGSLIMLIRSQNGIVLSKSVDRGVTWYQNEENFLEGPSSRFFISRLKSGRILLVNHYEFSGRNNLYAFLSDDECETWKYKLLIDERDNVSYPDAMEDENGNIFITYDHERGAYLSSLEENSKCAKEILYAKITEQDIISGRLVSSGSKLKQVISKLKTSELEIKNPYEEIKLLNDEELIEKLSTKTIDEALGIIFDNYSINCINMHQIQTEKLDLFITNLTAENRNDILKEIIGLVKSISIDSKNSNSLIEQVKKVILENIREELKVEEIAEKVGISTYYLIHLFKKTTGTTITSYRNSMRLLTAKKMLINTDDSITKISYECGFDNSSYFSKLFKRSEKISPKEYRKFNKKE